MPELCHANERSCICVLEVSNLTVAVIFLLVWDFGTVPTLRKTYTIKSLSRKSCENVCYVYNIYIYYTNYNIKYIYTTYTRLNTCFMSISRFFLTKQGNTSIIEAIFLYSGCGILT